MLDIINSINQKEETRIEKKLVKRVSVLLKNRLMCFLSFLFHKLNNCVFLSFLKAVANKRMQDSEKKLKEKKDAKKRVLVSFWADLCLKYSAAIY
jgi:hypothetical protein